jgi:SNF2 family DNA or RNA helicase
VNGLSANVVPKFFTVDPRNMILIYDRQPEPDERFAIYYVKIDDAEEIVETARGQPVLIAWTYKHDRDRLAQRLKAYKPRELKTDKDIDDWNAGRIKVLLMHPASGGHGLNLQQGGNILVWFGQTWSLELYQQLNTRLDRQGQTRTVTIHHLLAEGTIDMDVARALVGKTGRQDGLMDAVKARVGRYLRV